MAGDDGGGREKRAKFRNFPHGRDKTPSRHSHCDSAPEYGNSPRKFSLRHFYQGIGMEKLPSAGENRRRMSAASRSAHALIAGNVLQRFYRLKSAVILVRSEPGARHMVALSRPILDGCHAVISSDRNFISFFFSKSVFL